MNIQQISSLLLPKVDLKRVVKELRCYLAFFKKLNSLNDDLAKLQLIMQYFQGFDLINILLVCDLDEAAQLYGNALTPNIDLTDAIDLNKCDPQNVHNPQFSFGRLHEDPQFEKLYNVDETEKISDAVNSKQPYPLEGDERGYCFILINVFTIGTFIEMQKFRNIFHKLKFKVIFRKNLNKEEIIKELDKVKEDIAKASILKPQYAFIFLYLGHGNQNNVIEGFDSKLDGETSLPIANILIKFNETDCPQLDGKPKVFIFNCCRGVNEISCNQPVRAQPYQRIALPRHRDFVICYSTLDGYKASVDYNSGTTFGRTLALKLLKNVRYKDLETLFRKTNKSVIKSAVGIGQDEQPIEWTSNSRRKLFLYLKL